MTTHTTLFVCSMLHVRYSHAYNWGKCERTPSCRTQLKSCSYTCMYIPRKFTVQHRNAKLSQLHLQCQYQVWYTMCKPCNFRGFMVEHNCRTTLEDSRRFAVTDSVSRNGVLQKLCSCVRGREDAHASLSEQPFRREIRSVTAR